MSQKPRKIRDGVRLSDEVTSADVWYCNAKAGEGLKREIRNNDMHPADEAMGGICFFFMVLFFLGSFLFFSNASVLGIISFVGFLFSGLFFSLHIPDAWRIYKKKQYFTSLDRLPKEDLTYRDPYYQMAHRLIKEAGRVGELISAWNAYVHRCYDLDLIPRDPDKEALYEVLVATRDQIEHEAECLSEMFKMRREEKKGGEPVDLVRMRQNLERIAINLGALQKTRSEMRQLEEVSGDVLEETVKLDAIQPEISRELPEAERLRLKRLAAKRAQQPS